MNRQLSELSEMISADELNDAIDDRNFPQAHLLSRGRNNSVCSNTSNVSDNRTLSNVNHKDVSTEIEDNAKTARNGFMKREHPTSLMFSNGNTPDKSSDSVKTATTPRTSTTPGVFFLHILCFEIYLFNVMQYFW